MGVANILAQPQTHNGPGSTVSTPTTHCSELCTEQVQIPENRPPPGPKETHALEAGSPRAFLGLILEEEVKAPESLYFMVLTSLAVPTAVLLP